MSFVEILEDMSVMMSMNTHLKVVLGFRGLFNIDFLFIVDILHDVQKGSGSTLSSMSFQIFSVSPARIYLVNMCPNLWCNHSKETFFLGICFCSFEFYFVFTKNACFCCELCINVTVFCLLSLNKTLKNPLWKSQLRPKLINVTTQNNQLHKSGANSTLYNLAMKGFPLPSHILFGLILFVLLWQNSHLQFWYIYLFPPMGPL